jgi:hypothetical protein
VANVRTDTAGNMPLEHGRGQGESRGGLLARVGMKSERQRCHSKDSHHASDDGSRISTTTMRSAHVTCQSIAARAPRSTPPADQPQWAVSLCGSFQQRHRQRRERAALHRGRSSPSGWPLWKLVTRSAARGTALWRRASCRPAGRLREIPPLRCGMTAMAGQRTQVRLVSSGRRSVHSWPGTFRMIARTSMRNAWRVAGNDAAKRDW